MEYTLELSKFINQMLPGDLRTQVRKDWLNSLMVPGMTLHADFITKVGEVRDEVALNGQKLTIEWYLNNLFDFEPRRIYIEYNSSSRIPPAVYLISEAQDGLDTYLISESPDGDGTVNLYLSTESENEVDFTVYYPDTISPDLDAMNRAIKKIKKASKRYAIDTFTP